MCGIIGIIEHSGKSVDKVDLINARDIISHRGPDGAGLWLHKNIGFGHRRLAIIGIDDKGSQPMAYNHIVIVFNGEIYNYLELKEELSKEGYTFESTTDTEVLAAAYCHWGKDCLHRFVGIWAFALYDKKNDIIFSSRDRYGVKPFYYTKIKQKFCIASEIKQFTKIKGWRAQMNEHLCHEWLESGQYAHTEETLFEGVLQLKPGHSLIYQLSDNKYHFNQYYDLKEKIKPLPNFSFNEAKTIFHEKLSEAVRLQLRSDVKLGLTLSGGLDSSVLASLMKTQLGIGRGEMLDTFSACFKQSNINEEPFIDEVVKKMNLVSHKVFPFSEGLPEHMEKVSWHMDEPLPSLSDISHYLVFRSAKKQGVKVNLCGQGADEILGGYNSFYPVIWKSLLPKNPIKAIAEIGGFIIHQPKTFKNLIIKKSLQKKRINLSKEQHKLHTISNQSRLTIASIQIMERAVLPYILQSEDRLSMAHSIESRVPFLDHRLVEFCLSLPDDFKIKHGIRKRILRESFKIELPKPIYRRYDKIGFETPFSKQFQNHLPTLIDSVKKVEKPYFMGTIHARDHLQAWRNISFLKWKKIFFGE